MKRRSFIAIAGQAIAVSAVGLPGCHPVSASTSALTDDYCSQTAAKINAAASRINFYPLGVGMNLSRAEFEKQMSQAMTRSLGVSFEMLGQKKKVLPGHSRHTGR